MMQILAAMVVLFMAVSVVLARERFVRYVPFIAAGLILPGIAATLFLFNAPKDYMTRYPLLGGVLDPYGHFLFYAFGIVCGISLMVGYVLRFFYQSIQKRNETPPKPPTYGTGK